MSDNLHLWRYWRDKCGIPVAMEIYYSEELQDDPTLQAAVSQIRTAEAYIDQVMNAKAESSVTE